MHICLRTRFLSQISNAAIAIRFMKVCAPKDQEKVKKTSPLKQQSVEDYDEIVCIATVSL